METLSEGRLGNGRLDHDDNRHGLAAKILQSRRVGKLLTAVLAGLLLPVCAEARVAKGQTGNFIATFGGDQLVPGRLDPHVDYDINPDTARFFIHVPTDYNSAGQYGLIVWTDAAESINRVPAGWARVLDSRQFLFIAAENAGNNHYNKRRLGLAVMAALEMTERYRIDGYRIYAAGYSGGARISGMLGFYQPDVFDGTIQNCGADFYKKVPTVNATNWISTTGQPYGVLRATQGEIARARQVRFVLITGSNDFRHGNMLDIYNGGFAREGFHAKLFDVPGMGHDVAGPSILSEALDFLAGGE
jgi:predicted esterase